MRTGRPFGADLDNRLGAPSVAGSLAEAFPPRNRVAHAFFTLAAGQIVAGAGNAVVAQGTRAGHGNHAQVRTPSPNMSPLGHTPPLAPGFAEVAPCQILPPEAAALSTGETPGHKARDSAVRGASMAPRTVPVAENRCAFRRRPVEMPGKSSTSVETRRDAKLAPQSARPVRSATTRKPPACPLP